MEKTDIRYTTFVEILREELRAAFGCTEPIALAYAAAYAKRVLGHTPDRVLAKVSGSIIKNVKSVFIPNTGHLKGIEAALAAGIVAGAADKELEVISEIEPEQIEQIKEYLNNTDIKVEHIKDGASFEIILYVYADESYAKVHIIDKHTNIIQVEKDGNILLDNKSESQTVPQADRSLLNIKDILEFANTVDIVDVEDMITRQIDYNMAIANEGLAKSYGANIGKVLLTMGKAGGLDVATRAKAYAAAGSDARMNGCELPVVINSGSGNQGITTSVPVIIYAKELGVGKEKLYRALVLSNLVSIHQKTGIGTLSAYCGAVNAGAGSGAGIAYLLGGDLEDIEHTIVNALAIVSGIICDGAKASCAAKIATAVDAGIMGYNMYKCGQEFKKGDGIVNDGIEATIKNVGRLGKDGMKKTNEEIINMMLEN